MQASTQRMVSRTVGWRRVGPRRRPLLAALLLAGAHSASLAQTQMPGPAIVQNQLMLSATAVIEVQKDWLTVAFSTVREAADAAAVQSQLRQALELALVEARKAAKPGQVEVQTGGFSLHPRYAPPPPKGSPAPAMQIAGWQGQAELIVQGRDTQAISQLVGRLQSMNVARVGFTLSREAREKVEVEVTAEAIARFRARADSASKQFGFSAYTVREVSITTDGSQPSQPTFVRQQSMRASADEALPVEAGKGLVTATVSGSVQMK